MPAATDPSRGSHSKNRLYHAPQVWVLIRPPAPPMIVSMTGAGQPAPGVISNNL